MELVRATMERYVRLSDLEWDQVSPHWQLRHFAKGEEVTCSGVVEQRFGIIASGVHKLWFAHEGNEHCLGFSYDGSWTGVYDSFAQRRPSRFHLTSLTPSAAWMIGRDALETLYRGLPVMERFGRLILEELVAGRATREIEMLSLSAEERYRRLTARSPHLLQLVPQKDIASYLGMTPETFSRLRAKVH